MAEIRTQGHIVRVNSKVVGEIESLGDLNMKRGVKEYKSINTGNIVVVEGAVSVDPISIGVLYDPSDAAGAKELETAFNSGGSIPFEIELSDKGTTNGTTYTWDAVIISEFKRTPEEDGAILANFTVNVNGTPTVTPAA